MGEFLLRLASVKSAPLSLINKYNPYYCVPSGLSHCPCKHCMASGHPLNVAPSALLGNTICTVLVKKRLTLIYTSYIFRFVSTSVGVKDEKETAKRQPCQAMCVCVCQCNCQTIVSGGGLILLRWFSSWIVFSIPMMAGCHCRYCRVRLRVFENTVALVIAVGRLIISLPTTPPTSLCYYTRLLLLGVAPLNPPLLHPATNSSSSLITRRVHKHRHFRARFIQAQHRLRNWVYTLQFMPTTLSHDFLLNRCSCPGFFRVH